MMTDLEAEQLRSEITQCELIYGEPRPGPIVALARIARILLRERLTLVNKLIELNGGTMPPNVVWHDPKTIDVRKQIADACPSCGTDGPCECL